jgi:transcriptional regulator with XRE-family HTH domain
MSQTDLGTRLSKYLGDDVAQASISRWEKGQVDLGVEQVRALELVLNYKPGDLLVAANYVQRESNPQSSREFVMTDPALHPDLRKDAFNAYQAFLNASMRMFDSDRRMDLQA